MVEFRIILILTNRSMSLYNFTIYVSFNSYLFGSKFGHCDMEIMKGTFGAISSDPTLQSFH